jgi:hypothetical protein
MLEAWNRRSGKAEPSLVRTLLLGSACRAHLRDPIWIHSQLYRHAHVEGRYRSSRVNQGDAYHWIWNRLVCSLKRFRQRLEDFDLNPNDWARHRNYLRGWLGVLPRNLLKGETVKRGR